MERISRHIRGNVVAYLALFVALSGTAMASGVLNKKQVNKIITKRAPGLSVADANSAGNAKSADNAKNADKLGGVAAVGYQGFCKAGAIKGTLVINTTGISNTSFQNVTGFNCFEPGNTTSSVQIEKITNAYRVRFVGNKGPDASGSEICTAFSVDFSAGCDPMQGDPDAPGETVFDVTVHNSSGNPVSNDGFTLIVF